MDYNNPEFHTGERTEEQAGSGEYHSSEANCYGTYSDMPLNGNPNMNFAGQQNAGNYQQQRKGGTVFSLIVIIYVVFVYSTVVSNPDFKDIMENVQDGTFDYYNDYPFDEDWMNEFY